MLPAQGEMAEARRIRSADGLRGLAALAVLLNHALYASGHPALAGHFKSGVAIFFVLSGFVLYRPYARAIGDDGQLPDVAVYLRHRAIRILPAYWAVLTLWLLVAAMIRQPLSSPLAAYTLTQSYGTGAVVGLSQAWSLCVEVAFYLALPVTAFGVAKFARVTKFARGRAVQLAPIALIAIASIALRLQISGSVLHSVPAARTVAATSLPAFMDWFAIGIGLAVLSVRWESTASLSSTARWIGDHAVACWSAAALLFALAFYFQQPSTVVLSDDSLVTHLACGLASGLLLLPMTVSRTGSRLMSWLASAPMSYLGRISYGVFLLNWPVVEAIRATTVSVPRNAAAYVLPGVFTVLFLTSVLITTLGLADLCWRLVEQPAQARLRDARWRLRRSGRVRTMEG
jgi:peptidoglycan/LPS O-acetylase OafA/YrhL